MINVTRISVARSLVSANRWLRGIKTYRFPWCLTLVSANHASSNPGLVDRVKRPNLLKVISIKLFKIIIGLSFTFIYGHLL